VVSTHQVARSNRAGGASWLTSHFREATRPERQPRCHKLFAVQFTAAVTHEGSWYIARCLDVEVAGQGESVEEALANLREALPQEIEPPIITTVQLSA
jgi:hypothetical protein